MGLADDVADDEVLLDTESLKHLSREEILALDRGLATASDIENGLNINKGTLRKFAQGQAKLGVDVYRDFGIGRPSISNRYMIRLSVFTRMWSSIKDKIGQMKVTQQPFKIPKKGSTMADLIAEGGIYKLSRLEGLMKFKVRALKQRYYQLLDEGKNPKKEFGIYKDGKLFLVDMKRFGKWYGNQKLR